MFLERLTMYLPSNEKPSQHVERKMWQGEVLTHKPLVLGGVRTQFHMTKCEENLIFCLKLSTYGAAPNADGKGV